MIQDATCDYGVTAAPAATPVENHRPGTQNEIGEAETTRDRTGSESSAVGLQLSDHVVAVTAETAVPDPQRQEG